MAIRILDAPEDKRSFVLAYRNPASWRVLPAETAEAMKIYRDPGDYFKVELVSRYCAKIEVEFDREPATEEWVVFEDPLDQLKYVKEHGGKIG